VFRASLPPYFDDDGRPAGHGAGSRLAVTISAGTGRNARFVEWSVVERRFLRLQARPAPSAATIDVDNQCISAAAQTLYVVGWISALVPLSPQRDTSSHLISPLLTG
jgi:hypothetical protein